MQGRVLQKQIADKATPARGNRRPCPTSILTIRPFGVLQLFFIKLQQRVARPDKAAFVTLPSSSPPSLFRRQQDKTGTRAIAVLAHFDQIIEEQALRSDPHTFLPYQRPKQSSF
jgi:hypothetical protein